MRLLNHEEEEMKLRAIFASSPDAITVIDLNGNIVECNQATLDMLGYSSKEELIGKNGFALVAKKDRERAKKNLMKVFEQGSMKNIEYTALTKDGREFPAELSASVIKDSSGNLTGLVGITKEITERKRAEEALRESEEKFRRIFESANDCMIYLDRTGRILDLNRKAVEVFGGSKEELLGKHFAKVGVLPPRDIPTIMNAFAKGLAGEGPTLNVSIKNKRGQETPLECSASLMEIDGKLAGILVIARDVTERKIMEKRIAYLASIADNAKVAIATVDMNGIVTYCNKATEEMLGWTSKEVIGKPMARLCPNAGKQIEATLKEGFWLDKELDYLKKDGNSILCSTSTFLMADKDGKPMGIGGIAIDITERKKMEEELVRLSSAVKMSNDSIVISDIDGKIVDVNEATLKMYGTDDKKDLIRKNSFDLIAPEERERALAGMEEALEKGYIKSREYHIITKDGGRIPVEMSAAIMKDADGEPIGFVGISRDVTERKKAEEELRESESKSRTLLENLPQKIFFKDQKSVYITCNENYARDLKIKSTEITGKTDYDFYPKKLAEKYRADDKRIMESGKTEDIEEEYIQDDQKVFVHTVKTPVKDENGNVVGILGIFWDITDRKKSEERIRESEEKYRVLVESAADVIFTLDEAGNFLSANQEAAKALGKTPEEMIGKNMYDLFPKDIADLQMRGVKAVFQTGNPLVADETLTQTKLEPRWYSTTLMPVRDSNGKIIYAMAISRDITERKKMEEKLRQYSEHLEDLVQKRTEELLESEKRYSVLVEEASDGVVILQDEKIVFANRRGSEIFGYSKDELIGLPFEKLVDEKHLQLVTERYMRRLRGEKVPATYEIALIAKNGEYVPIEISATFIHYQGRPADIVILRDIRERKRMEKERLKLEKLATIGELATMVGHDLRNPLQSIENATYYLSNELPRLPPSTPIPQKALEMLQVINDSVNYTDKIIRDLHDFSVTKKPTFKKTNINTVIKETLSQAKAPKNVDLITELGHLPKIKADKDMIKRVFLNIATNAIQAMEKGGTLKVSTKKTKGFVEVSFEDTGIGMSKEEMKKIFTPFFTTRAKGMGMGLAICKRFVESHGGSIEVESQEEKGSTFTVKLPITKTTEVKTSEEDG